MSKIYIAVDGDNVGQYLEYLMLKNDPETLTVFAKQFSQTMDWFVETLSNLFNGSIVFIGGDNVLLSLDEKSFSFAKLEETKNNFANRSGKTLSIGIGLSARESYFALKFAKTSGKNRICRYEELDHV